MRKGMDTMLRPRHLQQLVEETTVDCYDNEEPASRVLTMIEEILALPFITPVLGVEASVVAVEMDDHGRLGVL